MLACVTWKSLKHLETLFMWFSRVAESVSQTSKSVPNSPLLIFSGDFLRGKGTGLFRFGAVSVLNKCLFPSSYFSFVLSLREGRYIHTLQKLNQKLRRKKYIFYASAGGKYEHIPQNILRHNSWTTAMAYAVHLQTDLIS